MLIAGFLELATGSAIRGMTLSFGKQRTKRATKGSLESQITHRTVALPSRRIDLAFCRPSLTENEQTLDQLRYLTQCCLDTYISVWLLAKQQQDTISIQ